MSSFTTPLIYEDLGNYHYKIHHAFTYNVTETENPGRIIYVPEGFITDLASIPRIFWNLLPPGGKYGKAAVVHDYLYQAGFITVLPDQLEFPTRLQADLTFRTAMQVLGVNIVLRNTMYSGVRVFGQKAWNEGHSKC